MDNKYQSGVIFTSNKETAYNFRNKCSKVGFNLAYAVNLESLFEYILNNIRSLIFIDVKCDNLSCLYDLLNKNENAGNHKFILIDDENKVDIIPNNNTLYKTDSNKVCELISKIISSNSDNELFSINKSKLYGITIEVVNNFGINTALQGSDYIVQAVCLCVEKGNKNISFQNDIYPIIASIYNTSIYNIEICIRRCVKDFSNKIANSDSNIFNNQKLTNISLIKHIINHVKVKYINSSFE